MRGLMKAIGYAIVGLLAIVFYPVTICLLIFGGIGKLIMNAFKSNDK